MNRIELAQLKRRATALPRISASQLPHPDVDRTLMLGDLLFRRHHVWLSDGRLHVALFEDDTAWKVTVGDTLYAHDLCPEHMALPDSWVFPEASEAKFMNLLMDAGRKFQFSEFRDTYDSKYAPYMGPTVTEKDVP